MKTYRLELKLIPLTQGKFAVVDLYMYNYFNQWRWFAVKNGRTFYAIRKLSKKDSKNDYQGVVSMHRDALGLIKDKLVVDHINGNGLHNWRVNLRTCTHAENCKNKKKNKNSASKYKGVTIFFYNKKPKYWRAVITINTKQITLGTFPFTEEGERDAAMAYNKAALNYFGNYACINTF